MNQPYRTTGPMSRRLVQQTTKRRRSGPKQLAQETYPSTTALVTNPGSGQPYCNNNATTAADKQLGPGAIAKLVASTKDRAKELNGSVWLEALSDGGHFSETLTRARSEESSNDLFRNTLGPVKQILNNNQLQSGRCAPGVVILSRRVSHEPLNVFFITLALYYYSNLVIDIAPISVHLFEFFGPIFYDSHLPKCFASAH